MRRRMWLTALVVCAITGIISWSGEAPAASTDASSKLSQEVAGGGVTVTATLLKDQDEATAIKLALSTHSVDLNGYQFEKMATLHDDGGRTYPLQAVESASGGGHHREAVLRFGKLSQGAKTVELVVKDLAGVPERTFRWSLTN